MKGDLVLAVRLAAAGVPARLLPEWAWHVVLDFAESSARPALVTMRLASLSRTFRRALDASLVLRDARCLVGASVLTAGGAAPRVVDLPLLSSFEEAAERADDSSSSVRVDLRRVASARLVAARVEHAAALTSSLEPLRAARSLCRLSLAGCEALVSTLEPLRALTQLRLLNLNGCSRVAGSLDALEPLSMLAELHLSWCQQLRGDITPLKALRKLRVVDLDWCVGLKGSLGATFGGTPAEGAADRVIVGPREQRQPSTAGDFSSASPPLPPLTLVSVYRAFRIWGFHEFRLFHPACVLTET